MRVLFSMLIVCIWLSAAAQSGQTEMSKAIGQMQQLYGMNFVYDASLTAVRPKQKPLPDKTLAENLRRVFGGTGIQWEIQDKYVLLLRPNLYTFSGYIRLENGESLLNATVFDAGTQTGTLSNEHGFFSMTLPEGNHVIRFSYTGCQEVNKAISLQADHTETVYLKENITSLGEVEIRADLNSPLRTTQTGKISLTPERLNPGFSLLSSPDLVKTLQSLPGISSGTELLSGLYVHGGRNDENLFLLDGTPVYQINHLGGLFSAFNTDIVKNVDFYKSGFPARYGGRTSSVIDVRTRDGNMKEHHGTFSIGLLDGRIQWEGPIVKDKTSFNIAMRRSWADLITAPAFLLQNRLNPNDKQNMRYAFHDINGKLTHRFSDRSRISLSLYSGNDLLKGKSNQKFQIFSDETLQELYQANFKLRWGNLNTALAWNYQFNPKLSGNFAAVYTHNSSMYDYLEDDRYLKDKQLQSHTRMERYNHSTIHDAGYSVEFDYRPNGKHHIRFGSNYLYHLFRPQSQASKNLSGNQEEADSIWSRSRNIHRGHELSVYAEDDVTLSRKLKVNAGLRYTLYQTNGSAFHSLEPRFALSYQWTKDLTLKLSYTEMSQFAHQLSSTYLNLPTDCWVPSTSRIRPMHSRQLAGGLYARLLPQLSLSLEGYYRFTERLLEYDTGNNLMLPADKWENLVRTGNGKSYGLEARLTFANTQNALEANYTLSWTKEKFKDFYPDWYPGKFDNRHKLNLAFSHKFNQRIDCYAAWTYHSGDRATVPTQYVQGPSLPGIPDSGYAELIYERPNNITLPAYHRLDFGINFRRTTKRGFERIWNISIYNVYCRINPFYTKVEQTTDGSFRGKSFGIFPILPSFSYTLKF